MTSSVEVATARARPSPLFLGGTLSLALELQTTLLCYLTSCLCHKQYVFIKKIALLSIYILPCFLMTVEFITYKASDKYITLLCDWSVPLERLIVLISSNFRVRPAQGY